jgi:predicted phage tail protein
MSTVKTTTGLAIDATIRAKVRAHNSNGWGSYSELNTAGATIEGIPAEMPTPVFDGSSSSLSQIAMTWTAPSGASAGGSSLSVTNYVLEWDAGTGNWGTHITTSTTSATSTGLAGGTTYAYRVAAINKHGTGPASSVPLSIVAAQAPDAPTAPATQSETVYVKISWTAPSSNYRDITQYEITIADSSGAYIQDTSTCDGSTTAVLTNRECLIPMTALWAAPFTLP